MKWHGRQRSSNVEDRRSGGGGGGFGRGMGGGLNPFGSGGGGGMRLPTGRGGGIGGIIGIVVIFGIIWLVSGQNPIDMLTGGSTVNPTTSSSSRPLPTAGEDELADFVGVVVKETEQTNDNDVPNRDELLDKASGVVTAAGDPNASPDAAPAELEPGLEAGPAAEAVKDRPYVSVEQMPELPGGGGTTAIVAAIQRLVKYPGLALRNGIEGKVFVSFTVNSKGEVIDVAIVKGLGFGLDEETMRAIKALPKFIPGRQNGREVSVSFTVPVTYRIQQN